MKYQACALAAVAAICFSFPIQSVAQQWPDKPVHILVPFPPGGGTDIQARLLVDRVPEEHRAELHHRQPHRRRGLIAAQLAVDSPPDGNTILFTSGSISVVATLYSK